MFPDAKATHTVFPVKSVFARQCRGVFRANDARVETLKRDIRARILLGEMLDELVAGGFAWTVPDIAWLDYLACSGRDIDDNSWTGGQECQELFDDVESADDIGLEGELVVCCGDFSARNKRMTCCDVGDQDVNFANFLEDGGDAVVVCDGSSVRGDFSVRILGFEGLLGFAKDLLSSLDKDEMLNTGFGEGLRDGEADAACLEGSVVEQPSLRRSNKPPPVTSTVLSFPSNVVEGAMRS